MPETPTLERAASELSKYLAFSPEEFLSFCLEDHMPEWNKRDCVRKSEGQLLYAVVRVLKPHTIVEFGTSRGCSTSHMEAAIKANGEGKIITVNISQKRRKISSPLVIPVTSDGLAYSRSIDFPIDLVFHDGPHNESFTLQLLTNCLPHLVSGGVILVHDALHPKFGEAVTSGIRLALGNDFVRVHSDPEAAGLGCWRKPR